jgi:O-antigen/teichoic acid export membrane protein
MAEGSGVAALTRGSNGDASSRLSLRANFSWVFAGNLIYSGCSWLVFVVLSKFFATPAPLGKYALGLAIAMPVFGLANLSLRAVLATDAAESFRFREYLTLRLCTTAAGVVGIAALAFATRPGSGLLIALVGLVKGVEAIADIFYGLFQRREHMDRIAISQALRGSFGVSVLIGTLFATGSLPAALGLQAAAGALVVVTVDRRNARRMGSASVAPHTSEAESHRARRLWQLAALSSPLAVVAFLGALQLNVPRYAVEHFLGEAPLGVFAAVAGLIAAGSTFATAAGATASPRLANYFARAELERFTHLLRRLVALAVALGGSGVLVALVIGEELLGFVYRPEYGAAADVLAVMMVFSLLSYVTGYLGGGVTAMRRFRIQALVHAARLALVTVLSITLTHRFGLLGAALALTIAQLAGAAIYLTLVIRYLAEARRAAA